jgi:hypothetical protein
VELKVGVRLRSAACTTEIIVIMASGDVDLRCGGQPMLPADVAPPSGGTLNSEFSAGTVLGKRYTDDDGLVLLCTKGGAGSLSVGATPLTVKAPNPLPASD